MFPYSGREIHGCPPVQEQRGHVHVSVVGGDVQGGESALEHRKEGGVRLERATVASVPPLPSMQQSLQASTEKRNQRGEQNDDVTETENKRWTPSPPPHTSSMQANNPASRQTHNTVTQTQRNTQRWTETLIQQKRNKRLKSLERG